MSGKKRLGIRKTEIRTFKYVQYGLYVFFFVRVSLLLYILSSPGSGTGGYPFTPRAWVRGSPGLYTVCIVCLYIDVIALPWLRFLGFQLGEGDVPLSWLVGLEKALGALDSVLVWKHKGSER